MMTRRWRGWRLIKFSCESDSIQNVNLILPMSMGHLATRCDIQPTIIVLAWPSNATDLAGAWFVDGACVCVCIRNTTWWMHEWPGELTFNWAIFMRIWVFVHDIHMLFHHVISGNWHSVGLSRKTSWAQQKPLEGIHSCDNVTQSISSPRYRKLYSFTPNQSK